MGIGILGPLSVDGDAAGLGPRDHVVLAALSLRPGDTVSPERLADALWGERPPATWTKVVQGCVARLRKVLGTGAIETTRYGYRLTLPAGEVDARRFERLVGRGRELLTLGEPERAAHVTEEALALWRGRALLELEDWEPGRVEAERLEELRRDAEEVHLDAALRAGRYGEVLTAAQARVAEAPLRERRWSLLALAQYQAGRQGEALRTLHRARTVLSGELGLDPGPDLVALEQAVLRQDPSLVADAALPEPSTSCPYLGLVSYDVADAEAFFGREKDVAACLRRLSAVGVLAVVGPSGSGKSSLVRAGVAAALGREGRRVVVITPGLRPTDALTALPSSGPAPVLVVDQCEQAVTLCDDGEERARFFAALVDHAERGPLVVALRADRLAELAAHPRFAHLVEPGLYLLGAMGEGDLRAAVEGPARQAGLLLEPGLVELLVQEVEGEPGALPLLSHALRATWECREGRTLTVEGYRATGGIRGAVAQSAEALYAEVPPGKRELVRDLLLRLVAPSPNGEPVRSRVPRRMVAADPAHEELVELLVGARLVTSDDGLVELAHEALARAWPRLRGWLDDDIEGQRILRHLTGAADTWQAMGRPDSELYRGARLGRVLDWRERSRPELTPTEHDFLDAGRALADAERRAAEEQARSQARQNTRLRALLGMSMVLGSVAVSQRNEAERRSRIATARQLAAAAHTNLDVDPERSILLALAAVEHTRSADGSVLPEAEEALHRGVTASPLELRVSAVGGRVDWSPDGRTFVAKGPEGSGTVEIRDAQTGERVRALRAHSGDVTDLAFNHDGTLLATTGTDGAARIWDPTTARELGSMAGPPPRWRRFGPSGPSFSAAGSLLAAAWPEDGTVRILDLRTGRIVHEIRSVPVPGRTDFDPGGARIAVTSMVTPMAVVVDLASSDRLLTLAGHVHPLTDVAWSPDGESIATSSYDGGTRVYDASTGQYRFTLRAYAGHVYALDWSPDGGRLVAASSSGSATVWQVTDRGLRRAAAVSAHDTSRGIGGVAFSPDGTRVVTGNDDLAACHVWDVSITGGREHATLPAVAITYSAVAYTADGSRLVTPSGARSVTVWDTRTFSCLRTLGGPSDPSPSPNTGEIPSDPPVASGAQVIALDVSGDGRLVAGAGVDGSVRVWDLETGRESVAVRPGPVVAPWMDVAWSPDGDILAVATNNVFGPPERLRRTGRVTIVDRSGREVNVLQEDVGVVVGSVAFSADGAQLVTTRGLGLTGRSDRRPGQLVIWDWRAADVERSIDAPVGKAATSPAGHLVATTTWQVFSGGTVDVWNAATGRHVTTLAGHTGGAMALAFSRDGSRLATGSSDGTVQIWDPYSGERLLVLREHGSMVSAVAFSPDGSQLASVGTEGAVRVWALDLDDLIAIAERRLTRRLTDEECRQYLHLPRCP
ncbi:MAG: BTAD domain-containing putative transcriptional regulator [Acidimicrobiia bacterium]